MYSFHLVFLGALLLSTLTMEAAAQMLLGGMYGGYGGAMMNCAYGGWGMGYMGMYGGYGCGLGYGGFIGK